MKNTVGDGGMPFTVVRAFMPVSEKKKKKEDELRQIMNQKVKIFLFILLFYYIVLLYHSIILFQ